MERVLEQILKLKYVIFVDTYKLEINIFHFHTF